MNAACAYFFETPAPTGSAGALALARLQGDVAGALASLGISNIPPGEVCLCPIESVDHALVMRWSATDATVSVHAGPAVARALARAMERTGIAPLREPAPRALFPHAADEFEALALAATTRATSDAAVDLLLDQPARWRAWDGRSPTLDEIAAHSGALNRLLVAPVVAAAGAVNVGKSTLLNALAGREASIVSADAGATRDHVGARVRLPIMRNNVRIDGGLTVAWLDTPGVRSEEAALTPIERAAADAARNVVATADLIVLCDDGATQTPSSRALALLGVDQQRDAHKLLRVRTKADLAERRSTPAAPHADVVLSAHTGQGLDELARTLAERLVPAESLHWPGPWLFDDRLSAAWRAAQLGENQP